MDKSDQTNNLNAKQQLSNAENEKYWRSRYEKLLSDYQCLQKKNQNLEDKLLSLADSFDKERKTLKDGAEREKMTLIADVNKLSGKLVDARIKLHDMEEKNFFDKHQQACNTTDMSQQEAFEAKILDDIPYEHQPKQLQQSQQTVTKTHGNLELLNPSTYSDPHII